MTGFFDKYFIVYTIVINNNDIKSPSMPLSWRWALGQNNQKYPLAIFDNIYDAKILCKILKRTVPYLRNNAVLNIKIINKVNLNIFINLYNIKLNNFYTESFLLNKNATNYTMFEVKNLFNKIEL